MLEMRDFFFGGIGADFATRQWSCAWKFWEDELLHLEARRILPRYKRARTTAIGSRSIEHQVKGARERGFTTIDVLLRVNIFFRCSSLALAN